VRRKAKEVSVKTDVKVEISKLEKVRHDLEEIRGRGGVGPIYLVDSNQKKPIPLFSVDLKVQVVQNVASYEMTHLYANLSGNPLEAIFLFPKEIDSVVTKMTCSITLQDGSKRFMETKIQSR
jgi:hypothetical protein